MATYECEVAIRITFLVDADDENMAKEIAIQKFIDDAAFEIDERDVDVYLLDEE